MKYLILGFILFHITLKSNAQTASVKDIEIKHLFKLALTEQINDRALFMKGIDISYYYEGYSEFKTEEL